MENNNSILSNYQNLKKSQKKGDGTPFYTRFVNRKLGQIFASILAYWNVSPNVITCVSGILTFGAYIAFLLIDSLSLSISIVLYIFLVLGFALDSSDGLVSRLLNKQSVKGEWLDHTFDAIKIPLGHGIAFLLIINRIEVDIYHKIILLLILVTASSLFLSNILKEKLLVIKDLKNNNLSISSDRKQRSNSLLRSVITLPLDYGVFMFMFLFSAFPYIFYQLYFIWGLCFILFTILSTIKSFTELSRI